MARPTYNDCGHRHGAEQHEFPLDVRVAEIQMKDPRYAIWCSCPQPDVLVLANESNNDSSGCKQVKTQLEDRYRAVLDRN